MKRSELLTIVEAALAAGRPRYARETLERLLAAWPGDLSARMAKARALLAEDDPMPALDLFEGIVAVDPERAEAQRSLGSLFQAGGRADRAAEAFAAAHVVDGLGFPKELTAPAWAKPAQAARQALARDNWREARSQAGQALKSAPDTPLASLLCLLATWRSGDLDLARPLAEGFHSRWPGCVAFSLCLAECLLAGAGDEVKPSGKTAKGPKAKAASHEDERRAITLLHEAGALDPAGEVVARYWGTTHPYRSLWPYPPDPELPGPLPQEVAKILGVNLLPSAFPATSSKGNGANGAGVSPKGNGSSDDLSDIREELSRLEAKLASKKKRKPTTTKATKARKTEPSTHFSTPTPTLPTHVLMTSKSRLARKYGKQQAAAINTLISDLADASGTSSGAAVVILDVDDAASLQPFELKPVNPDKAWDIKLLLRDLAAAVNHKGGQVSSVLILGGDEVIPFHRLPNPVDDPDNEVPSDSPYASPDENFLVPEWSVGRLPTSAGNDPEPFKRLLQAVIAAHRAQAPAKQKTATEAGGGLLGRILAWLLAMFKTSVVRPSGPPNFGYAARAWTEASSAVFNAIGDQSKLNTCPPLDVTGIPPEGLTPAPLSYFNLHGVEDGPEWYGQREANDPRSPQYPIALRPANIANSGRAPGIVFTEACYGANTLNKSIEDALCLKFLDSGTRAVVGSTKIAYGSVAAPLIGADLLGRMFWDRLKEGWPAGEALRLAKLAHAREMHARQGYLDGEDQKTLTAFMLYGDPLLGSAEAASQTAGKNRHKIKQVARLAGQELNLTADETAASDPGLSRPEAVAHIKSLVARHLPGMDESDVHIAQQRRLVPGAAPRGLGTGPAAKTLGPETGNVVFTLSKSLRLNSDGERAISQYVRVTVNRHGKVVKMAVSR
jgi:tetratricopeptide (TPR) repeat protein